MSLYLDNKDSFLSPKVSQYGNHSIMTNIYKPTKKKFVNIDTRFQEEYNTSRLASVTCKIPQQIIDVKSIQICSMELPICFYNFSNQRKNTFFVVKTSGNSYLVTIDDGQYDDATDLVKEINSKLAYATLIDSTTVFALNSVLSFGLNKNKIIQITNMGSASVTILWGVSESGHFDKYQLKMKLGWCLGFREPEYFILPLNAASDEDIIVAESILDLHTFRYLYLVIDEFNQTNPNSFITPSSSSFLSANTLARISLDSTSFGKVLSLNTRFGNIVSDIRVYSGKTDIQKLQLHIADEWGNLIDLNQAEFSFCLELQCE